ncbi:MAG: cytochrome c biogenesis protein CcdA [Candidatus Omnitrophica bacterium]|nr:cytochrome c biogenesis protein CcdA [Candidatus Omnitrophota bacterium]
MENVSFGIAFLAGVLSFLSPCVLPLVPGYISFLSGTSLEELKRGAPEKKVLVKAGIVSIFFVLGFSVVFTALGASATFIGRLLSEYQGLITKIAGVVIVLLGLHLVGLFNLSWLNYQKKFDISPAAPSPASAFFIGMAFGFGWTPCVGPILAGILAIAATQETVVRGVLLLLVYSMGLGIPFILTGFAVGVFMKFFERYKRFIRTGEVIAGLFLIIVGILIFFDSLGVLTRYIPDEFYGFAK